MALGIIPAGRNKNPHTPAAKRNELQKVLFIETFSHNSFDMAATIKSIVKISSLELILALWRFLQIAEHEDIHELEKDNIYKSLLSIQPEEQELSPLEKAVWLYCLAITEVVLERYTDASKTFTTLATHLSSQKTAIKLSELGIQTALCNFRLPAISVWQYLNIIQHCEARTVAVLTHPDCPVFIINSNNEVSAISPALNSLFIIVKESINDIDFKLLFGKTIEHILAFMQNQADAFLLLIQQQQYELRRPVIKLDFTSNKLASVADALKILLKEEKYDLFAYELIRTIFLSSRDKLDNISYLIRFAQQHLQSLEGKKTKPEVTARWQGLLGLMLIDLDINQKAMPDSYDNNQAWTYILSAIKLADSFTCLIFFNYADYNFGPFAGLQTRFIKDFPATSPTRYNIVQLQRFALATAWYQRRTCPNNVWNKTIGLEELHTSAAAMQLTPQHQYHIEMFQLELFMFSSGFDEVPTNIEDKLNFSNLAPTTAEIYFAELSADFERLARIYPELNEENAIVTFNNNDLARYHALCFMLQRLQKMLPQHQACQALHKQHVGRMVVNNNVEYRRGVTTHFRTVDTTTCMAIFGVRYFIRNPRIVRIVNDGMRVGNPLQIELDNLSAGETIVLLYLQLKKAIAESYWDLADTLVKKLMPLIQGHGLEINRVIWAQIEFQSWLFNRVSLNNQELLALLQHGNLETFGLISNCDAYFSLFRDPEVNLLAKISARLTNSILDAQKRNLLRECPPALAMKALQLTKQQANKKPGAIRRYRYTYNLIAFLNQFVENIPNLQKFFQIIYDIYFEIANKRLRKEYMLAVVNTLYELVTSRTQQVSISVDTANLYYLRGVLLRLKLSLLSEFFEATNSLKVLYASAWQDIINAAIYGYNEAFIMITAPIFSLHDREALASLPQKPHEKYFFRHRYLQICRTGMDAEEKKERLAYYIRSMDLCEPHAYHDAMFFMESELYNKGVTVIPTTLFDNFNSRLQQPEQYIDELALDFTSFAIVYPAIRVSPNPDDIYFQSQRDAAHYRILLFMLNRLNEPEVMKKVSSRKQKAKLQGLLLTYTGTTAASLAPEADASPGVWAKATKKLGIGAWRTSAPGTVAKLTERTPLIGPQHKK